MAAPDLDDFYRRYAPVAYRRARHLLGNEDDARELVHDVFASLLDRPEQFRGKSSLTTFMYSAVTHACLNRLRNQRNRARLLQQGMPEERESPQVRSAEALASLRSLLARMPEDLATVAIYYHGEGLTHDDIARILECSPRHVGNLVARVRHFIERQEAQP
ncbi:MAG: RNA polymerase sigma factor [Myxococcales bacterium]|nr:RNA polymerase sigma factor [Myxococcales bacterium]